MSISPVNGWLEGLEPREAEDRSVFPQVCDIEPLHFRDSRIVDFQVREPIEWSASIDCPVSVSNRPRAFQKMGPNSQSFGHLFVNKVVCCSTIKERFFIVGRL